MVGRLAQRFHDLHVAPGVDGGPADHGLEVRGGNLSGAGKRGEDAAGRDAIQKRSVSILIAE